MIPQLTSLPQLSSVYSEFLDELRNTDFEGDIRSDYGSRLVTATDNSVYQLVPEAIVYPRSTRDVEMFVALAAKERFHEIVIAPRGGGTGTNGQSLCEGIIVDVSRYMNEILELNLEEGWVRVQPGVVLDQLNHFLEPHGVFFAPSLSPSNRATLGGMISTDACGRGSRIYGRTSEHVIALTSVLIDGSVWTSEAIDESTLEQIKIRENFVGEIHRVVDEVVSENSALIDATFPKLTRFLTGYNLAKVRSESSNRFNLNWLLTGSEGTLGIITEAKLKLSPIPKYRRLVVLRYGTFSDALGSAEWIVETDPAAIETIDETVLALAREDVIWNRVSGVLREDDGKHTAAINLVEYVDSSPDVVTRKASALIKAVTLRTMRSVQSWSTHP